MERDFLKRNLLRTAEEVIQVTQEYVTEKLPTQFQLVRRDNRQPRKRTNDAYLGPFSADEIIDYYWSKETHPAWLDLDVVGISGDCCQILVESKGRWTSNDADIWTLAKIKESVHPPFSAGISLPPFCSALKMDLEQIKSTKFSLYWRDQYRPSLWRRLVIRFYMSSLYARYFKWRYK